jgi:hypothetical protein
VLITRLSRVRFPSQAGVKNQPFGKVKERRMWAEGEAARKPSQVGNQADKLKTHQQQLPEQWALRHAPSEKCS